MTKRRTIIAFIAVLLLCAGLFAGCANDTKTNAKTTYTIEVKSEGGMPLSDIRMNVYKDSTQENLVWAAETDDNGTISFEAEQSEQYVAVLEEAPQGYNIEESYPIQSGTTEIALQIALLDASDLSACSFELGDVMCDFTVSAVDGTEYKLSDLLEEKKAVVLNFWFLNCGPCKMEFPYMQQAYEEYQEKLEILAMNPVDGTNETIETYASELGLTIPMAVGDPAWANCMSLTAYPTTVVIDRYGTIAMIHKGSITDKETFTKVFEYFTSDDYTQTTIRNISDIE